MTLTLSEGAIATANALVLTAERLVKQGTPPDVVDSVLVRYLRNVVFTLALDDAERFTPEVFYEQDTVERIEGEFLIAGFSVGGEIE